MWQLLRMLMVVPSVEDFRTTLSLVLKNAENLGWAAVTVRASELNTQVRGYADPRFRIPLCCDVMVEAMWSDDELLSAPPQGIGGSLTIRYRLPRRRV